jgi:hypothetical protein
MRTTTPLEPALPAGADPSKRRRDIERIREAVQLRGRTALCAHAGTQPVIRPLIGQDWQMMLDQGVNPWALTPQFLDPREVRSLQDNPDRALTWKMLDEQLQLVSGSEFMATVSDARGCIIWTGGNSKLRNEASEHGVRCGAQWYDMGTNGIRLVIASGVRGDQIRGAQIYGPEHWVDFQFNWTCTAVGVFDPHTHRLFAVINVTGPWWRVHRDTLGWLVAIAQRIEDALPSTQRRAQWRRLAEAAGPLERIGGPALVIDAYGVVVLAHESTFQTGDPVIEPKAAGIAPGQTYLPALGWCVLEPLPARGWLVRLRSAEEKPAIRVTLDLTDPAQAWVRVIGPNVFWQSSLRPLHAAILQQLAEHPDGLTAAELGADRYGAKANDRIPPEMCKLGKELGGLLHPTSCKSGGKRYRFHHNAEIDIQQSADPQ